jgi:hypothetical protein
MCIRICCDRRVRTREGAQLFSRYSLVLKLWRFGTYIMRFKAFPYFGVSAMIEAIISSTLSPCAFLFLCSR